MSMKEELLKLRGYRISENDLNDKVEKFIDWYYKNMVQGRYTDIGEYYKPIEMRNLIEKMAVWYELRYPDYEINRLMPGSQEEKTEVNAIMFQHNPYIKNLPSSICDISHLDWTKFYNADAFINSLSNTERIFFSNPRYRRIIHLDNNLFIRLFLTKSGFVEISENVGLWSDFAIKDEELKGLHIKEVLKLLKARGIRISRDSEIEREIQSVDKWIYQKEEMLNCVMYRIIERGRNRVGPRRAFLFAKEFDRNIDIPMMYAIDLSDPGLKRFINEYFQVVGPRNLMCYKNYFSRASKNDKIEMISLEDVIRNLNGNGMTFYTIEEENLHQRLVHVLASQIDAEELRKEKVKQLRIERKRQQKS